MKHFLTFRVRVLHSYRAPDESSNISMQLSRPIYHIINIKYRENIKGTFQSASFWSLNAETAYNLITLSYKV